MDDRHYGPAEAFDGGEAHVGGTLAWSYVWYAVPPKEAKDATRAQMREDAEIRLARSRDEAKKQATINLPSSAPSPVPAEKNSKNSKQKRPRRTKAEMAQFRAAQAARLEEIAILATPAWLAQPNIEEEEFMKQYREAEWGKDF